MCFTLNPEPTSTSSNAAPGAMDLAVSPLLLPARRPERRRHLARVPDHVLARHQHRVGGIHDDQTGHPHRRHQPVPGVDVAVADAFQERIAPGDVAGVVPGNDIGQRGPRADVGPAGFERHHHGVRGALHHRVVHRNGRRPRKGPRLQPHEARFRHRLVVRPRHRVPDRRLMHAELTQISRRLEHEHAAVPVVAALLEVAGGLRRRRLLHEALDPAAVVADPGGAGRLDVSVPGLGVGGGHPEGHEVPGRGLQHGRPHRAREPALVADDVVGREHQQDGVLARVAAHQRRQRRRGDGRRGVSSHRLQQHGRGVHADGLELFGHHEAVGLVAHHDGRPQLVERGQTPGGGLEQGVLVHQRDELLRMELTGQRPEPGAGAAREDDGEQDVAHRGQLESRD